MKLTLNKSWELCLKQWAWMIKQIKVSKNPVSPADIWSLKRSWNRHNSYGNLFCECFFCEYTLTQKPDDCSNCPGRKVDKDFNCCDNKYDFEDKPLKFYAKLKELNKIRLGKKNKKVPK